VGKKIINREEKKKRKRKKMMIFDLQRPYIMVIPHLAASLSAFSI